MIIRFVRVCDFAREKLAGHRESLEKFMVWCGEDTCTYGIWGMHFVHSYGVTGVCSTHSEDVADVVFILSIFTIIFLEGETGLVATYPSAAL